MATKMHHDQSNYWPNSTQENFNNMQLTHTWNGDSNVNTMFPITYSLNLIHAYH